MFEDDVLYARHRPRRGAVLIVGVGAVGGSLADELAHLGITPLRLVDHDTLAPPNIVRHRLGASALGHPKASTLANRIREDFPRCDVVGFDQDFLKLSKDEQLLLVREADVVVAATDNVECQRRINEVCLEAGVTAVYPGFWVDTNTGTRDAEIGEVFWYRPEGQMPCYVCLTGWRQETGDAARGGARADIQFVVLATVGVVCGLLDPGDERAPALYRDRPLILLHGFTPHSSEALRSYFHEHADDSGLVSLEVPFPSRRCPACGGQRAVAGDSHVTLHTSVGDIRLCLFSRAAPRTVRNFVGLASGSRDYTDPRTGLPGDGHFTTAPSSIV